MWQNYCKNIDGAFTLKYNVAQISVNLKEEMLLINLTSCKSVDTERMSKMLTKYVVVFFPLAVQYLLVVTPALLNFSQLCLGTGNI